MTKWLDHARIQEIAAPLTLRLAVFTLGWTLMIIAMMLPGTLMLLARCLGNEPFRARRIALLILAYLAVWTIFGGFSYWGDTLLHEFVEQVPALAGVIAPGVLLLAGVYQLTPMKRSCLARCRPEGTAFRTIGQSRHQNTVDGGIAAWSVLPGKLLGGDAADVRPRWGQSDLDADSRHDHDGRTPQSAGRRCCSTSGCRTDHCISAAGHRLMMSATYLAMKMTGRIQPSGVFLPLDKKAGSANSSRAIWKHSETFVTPP